MASISIGAVGDRDRGLSVGRVFALGFDVIRANPVATLGTTFVLTALPGLALGRYGYGMAAIADADASGAVPATFWTAAAIGGLPIAVLWAVAYGALVHATIAHGEGRRADWRAMLHTGALRAAPLFVVYFLYWILVALGSALLLVPGVMLGVMWSLATPAVAAERTGILGAFSRSRALTRGVRWKVFGVLLVALVAYIVIAGVLSVLTLAGDGSFAAMMEGTPVAVQPSLLRELLSAGANTVLVTWMVTLGAALFVELRDRKDGPDADRMADIFA